MSPRAEGALGALLRMARTILRHPLTRKRPLAAMGRFLAWQVASRLDRGIHVRPFVGDTRLAIRRSMHAATANIYVGLMEFEEMGFALHLLRDGDLFADVGANVGTYSVLAAGVARARVLAIEPNPASLAALERNVALNRIDELVRIAPMAAGARAGTLSITTALDSLNHVAAPGEAATCITVRADRLDHLLAGETPLLVKIDVEGFESAVLAGAGQILDAPGLKALIIELNGSGARYGFDDQAIDKTLRGHGFAPHSYDPLRRSLDPRPTHGLHNTLYVRDAAFVRERLAGAAPFTVLGERI